MPKKINIIRINKKKEKITDTIVEEKPLIIFVNKKELVTLLCSQNHLKYLIIGHLISEGLVNNIKEIRNIKINEHDGVALTELKHRIDIKSNSNKTIYSGCSSFYSLENLKIKRLKNRIKIKKERVMKLMKQLQLKSKLFQQTGGVHASALANKNKIIFFTEDIGRHNTIDKIIGYSLIKKLNLKNKMILTTGRLSSEMVLKSAKVKIPIIVSKSAPTDMAVNLAKRLNITLIGFARGKRFNVYNNDKYII